MSRAFGTVVRGVRLCADFPRRPTIVVAATVDTVLSALQSENITPRDRDVVAVTESVVARCQGNYATVDQIAADVRAKTGGETVGVTFPILSRNRFSLLLRGIATGVKKVVLLLSYPSDEVGNHLISPDQLDEAGIDPWHDVLSLSQFRAAFGEVIHPFTGVDYVAYYKEIIESAGAERRSSLPTGMTRPFLDYTDTVICGRHPYPGTQQAPSEYRRRQGWCWVWTIFSPPLSIWQGYNEPVRSARLQQRRTDERVKAVSPQHTMAVAQAIGTALSDATGKQIEAMIYGDGAFKDPAGKIWELADPVVSPGFTAGLVGTPNELKLKYLADHDFGELEGDALQYAIREKIAAKDASVSLVGNMVSEGTTPRHLTDLIGSLCDLTSGSGDKGTPIIYIQGYFDNYTND